MRTGILCHSSCGGSARVAAELAAELARRSHQVHLFARTTPFCRSDHPDGVVVHSMLPDGDSRLHPAQLHVNWPSDEFEAFVTRLVHAVVHLRLDLLHFHYALPFAFITAEVGRRLGKVAPVLVGTLHGTDVDVYARDPILGPRLAEALGSLDALTTVSRCFAVLAAELLGLPVRPQVIPNFVDLAQFRPRRGTPSGSDASAGERPGPPARPRIIHVSNFRPVKDTLSVAHIFLGLRERMEVELWLVGDGQGMDQLRALFKAAGAENDVRYWGLQRHVAPLMAEADLLLMTSLTESFCLAALEAMACGVPVLSTHVGGVPELVVHGETGYLFPVGEHAMAVELAVDLLFNPTRHKAMAEAALARAREYERKHVVDAYVDLYRRLVDARLATSAQILDGLTAMPLTPSYAEP